MVVRTSEKAHRQIERFLAEISKMSPNNQKAKGQSSVQAPGWMGGMGGMGGGTEEWVAWEKWVAWEWVAWVRDVLSSVSNRVDAPHEVPPEANNDLALRQPQGR